MRDTRVIPIDKKYDKEELCRAVFTYLYPSNDRERVMTETGNNSYIVKTEWLQVPKKGKWVVARVVKLTFSENSCYVDIEYSGEGKENNEFLQTAGFGGAIAGIFGPLVVLGTAAVGGVVAKKVIKERFKKFKEDLYKLIEGYLCTETRIKSTNTIKSKYECECGAVLSKGAKFCTVCGKKVEVQPEMQPEEIICECGAVLPGGTKFCSMCGKALF